MPAAPPPAHLLPPDWVLDKLRGQTRESYVLDHGFGPKYMDRDWWQRKLDGVWPDRFRISLDPNDRGADRLTRGDLFDLAQSAKSDDQVLTVFWHVLMWGSGTRHRNDPARIRSIAEDERGSLDVLRRSAALAYEGDRRGAYSTLVRVERIGGLGPSFATKFLYFSSSPSGERVCPILDREVAKSLGHPSIGWSIASAEWRTNTYVHYCELLDRWAQVASGQLGRPVMADEMERALFRATPED